MTTNTKMSHRRTEGRSMCVGFSTQPDQGWSWAVLLASFGSHFIHGFFLMAVGLLQLSLLDHFQADVLQTSWALSIFLGLFSISGPLAGLIANVWSCRVSMVTGGLVVSLSHVVTAFMPSISYVIFTLGIFGGVGIGLCYTSSFIVVGYNFEKKRSFASGIAVSGAGIGAFALAPIMQSVSDAYGYTGLWLMCGGLTLQYCVFGAMFFPSELELQRKIEPDISLRSKYIIDERTPSKLERLRKSCHVLYQKELLFVFICMFLCSLGVYLIYLHFASYVTSVGFTKLDAAFLLSVCGVCSCLSRVLVGSAANSSNIDEFVMFAGTFSLTGLVTVLFPFYGHTFGGQMFYMVTLGSYSGCCYAILNSICVELAGINNLGTVYGFVMFFTGIGCFSGPLLGGMIVNVGGTYGQAIFISGILILVGSLFGWASGAGKRKRLQLKKNEEFVVIENGQEDNDKEKDFFQKDHKRPGDDVNDHVIVSQMLCKGTKENEHVNSYPDDLQLERNSLLSSTDEMSNLSIK